MPTHAAPCRLLSASALALICGGSGVARAEPLHFTYLWHLEQPIYWPDPQVGGADRYERAWESIVRTDGGAAHPENNLREIFGKADRVAAYQGRVRDAINQIRGFAEAGAQVSYSGGLIENIESLAAAGQLGYGSSWFSGNREARGWRTSGQSKPRLDMVIFPFHHPLLPLVDVVTVRKELQLYKAVYERAWGMAAPISRGLFPPEMCFSERLIPALVDEGVSWAFVSAEKISRANEDFPVIFGSGGVNADPPNRADMLNPAQGDYYRLSISRGCAPAEAYPQSLTPQRARHVDPATGIASEIIVVPCSQGLGWKDGFAPLGTDDFDALEANNDPARPMLIVLAHDGDNAWGGGFSYYMEATPTLVSQAAGKGYTPTVVEEYLADHPVPADAVVHVEDGGWINADGDFGAPQMINWNWPLIDAQGKIDVENGWHEDPRNWAVITAAQNMVETAEQMEGPARIEEILDPDAGATLSERAWHYFLGSLNSGYLYYGAALDLEVKPTIGCNEAVTRAQQVIDLGGADLTAPTIWIPQRHPWNPGSVNFGPQYGYQQTPLGPDFWVWSFVDDVSGLARVELNYLVDDDGINDPATLENDVYPGVSGGSGAWATLAMTARDFPASSPWPNPELNFFESPLRIADQYHAKIGGLSDVLVSYYIEAEDALGNVKRSPIQHVFVGGEVAPPPEFVIDGQLDDRAVEVASGAGATLWAALDGDALYLATEAPQGDGLDRFLYLAQSPGALVPANWAKGGQIAAWDAFVGHEESNGFIGFFDTSAGIDAGVGSVVEATIDLAALAGGTAPATIYVAAAAFESADGGALDPARQAPASMDGNLNLDASEYVEIDLASLIAPVDCLGDANGDRSVDFGDVTSVLGHWLADYTPRSGPGDANGDGAVNFGDVTTVLGNWLSSCGP